MPEPNQQPLLDQLIAQQTARQGHPLAQTAAIPQPGQDPRLAGLLQSMLGEDAIGPLGAAAAQQLKGQQLPSEVVGNTYGRRGDIELPAAAHDPNDPSQMTELDRQYAVAHDPRGPGPLAGLRQSGR